MKTAHPENEEIAHALEEIAEALKLHGENPFRIRSFLRAAREVGSLESSARRIYERMGVEGLQQIPGVGEKIGGVIEQYFRTGRFQMLDSLMAQIEPTAAFATLPGVGPQLARRIVETLEVKSLEELEQAAHEGRLEEVEGIGAKKAANIRHALAGILSSGARRRAVDRVEDAEPAPLPPIDRLLAIDEEYRRRAIEDDLPRIAPRRFNPANERWLPILETSQDGWDFTALFSNTKRAHDLEMTHDWVVIYFERDGRQGQCTVVTETSGLLRDQRVVRGHEPETRRYYEQGVIDEPRV